MGASTNDEPTTTESTTTATTTDLKIYISGQVSTLVSGASKHIYCLACAKASCRIRCIFIERKYQIN